jgi:general secretion pathway protein I
VKKHKGFSLLEVLVALVIMSFALAAILQLFQTGLRNVDLSEQYWRAAIHSRSQLALVGVTIPIEEGSYNGEFEDGYRWQLNIWEMPAPEGESKHLMQHYQVQVISTWDEAKKTRQFVVDSIRVKPV